LLKDIPVLKIIVTDSTFTVYQKGINKVDMNGMMPSSTRLFYGLKCMERKAIISMKGEKTSMSHLARVVVHAYRHFPELNRITCRIIINRSWLVVPYFAFNYWIF
jgi:hypothetical protein